MTKTPPAPPQVPQSGLNNGLGYSGEFRIGAITLAIAGDKGLRLRHENVGVETEVSAVTLEGLLEEHYFTRKVDDNGNVTTKSAPGNSKKD